MRFLFFLLSLSLLFTFQSCGRGKTVDLVIHNAKIHTMDESDHIYDAVAIKDGKIVEVGAEHQIMNRYNADEYINAETRDVFPGFTDAHGHLLSYAKGKLGVDLFGCKSYNDLIVRIEKYQRKNQRKFIVGAGWDQSLWEDKELPNNQLLSEKFPNTPICLFRIDGHAALVNDYLLRQADVIRKVDETPQLNQGGYYVLSPSGQPTGVLVDNAMNPVLEMIPDYPEEDMKQAIMDIQAELFSYGITGVHEAGMKHKEVELFNKWVDNGDLKLNIYGMLLPTEANFNFAKKMEFSQTTTLSFVVLKFLETAL